MPKAPSVLESVTSPGESAVDLITLLSGAAVYTPAWQACARELPGTNGGHLEMSVSDGHGRRVQVRCQLEAEETSANRRLLAELFTGELTANHLHTVMSRVTYRLVPEQLIGQDLESGRSCDAQ